MDPCAQDVVRCDVCDNNTAEMHCDTCFVNLCKACVGEHMFDESVDHKIVKFKSRKTTPIYPSCLHHTKERCEMYCTHCDTPICSACVASDKHNGHKISQLLEKCDIIKKNIEEDNEELRSKLAPLYQKILHDLEMIIRKVEEKCEEASKLISQQGDKWHKEIDTIVSQLKTQLGKIKEKEVKNLKVNKGEMEIALSKISSVLQSNEERLESNDLRTAIEYKSQNATLNKGLEIVDVSLPNFTPMEINQQSIREQFGALSTDVSEGHSLITTNQLLMDKPIEVSSIGTGIDYLKNIACLKSDHIWTGQYHSVELFDFNKKEKIKSLRFDGGFFEQVYDIAVLQNGELVYSFSGANAVYIVRNEKAEILINLHYWDPRGICVTSSGDLLITMKRKDQSKVVRYDGTVEKQVIQVGGLLRFDYLYITENRNSDICISRDDVIEVFTETGERRFEYTGHRPPPKWNQAFTPKGIATDSYCHILIADINNKCVHIIDQDGKFLQYIDCGMRRPWGLCIDSHDFLYLADNKKKSTQIVKVKFLNL
uniref:Tripartite motif-containing protein 45 n=1 Tax=Magallana gigas TaxID=29159 RepID=K1QWP2_MAGGI|eukprot:XP_011425116.1 PREDICTED: E3 ubiquitin-protein ligase TRIM71 [Crassostrea gigas]